MFEQDRVNGRFQRRVQAEPAIRACFLIGSHGRATADGFSDIDAVLVFATAELRDYAWRNRQAFVESIMPYVALKCMAPAEYELRTVYSNGTQLDLFFAVQDQLAPGSTYRHIRLIKDSDGWGAQFQAASAREPLTHPTLTRADLEAIDSRFWVLLWEVLRQLQRGDATRPFSTYITLLHETLPPLMAALPEDDPVRSALVDVAYGSDTRATTRHLGKLIDRYLAARDAVNRRYNLQYFADRGFENEFKRLVERIGG